MYDCKSDKCICVRKMSVAAIRGGMAAQTVRNPHQVFWSSVRARLRLVRRLLTTLHIPNLV